MVYGYLCDEPDGTFEANKRPSIGIVSPANNSEISGDITMTVDVTDPNGEQDIAWVEYYNDWHKIGQSNEAPYQFTWKRPVYGDVKLLAKVVDKSGFSTKSEVVEINAKPLNYDITIFVKDSLKDIDIQNCRITIQDSSKTTDANGEVFFEQVSGLTDIQFEHENYVPLNISNLSIYNDTTLVFYLQQKKSEVGFVVHDNDGGAIFQGIPVTFNSELQVTNQFGEAVFEAYEGSYNYLIEKNSYQTEAGTIDVISDTTFHFFLVRTEAEIKFVLKEESSPVNSATVVLNQNDTLFSSVLGIARFKGQSVQNTFDYYIYKNGYHDVTGSLFLQTDTTVNIQMQRIPVGNEEINKKEELKIWPNPVSKELNIQSGREIKEVNLFSISGNKKSINTKMETEILKFDLSKIQSGIYLLKIEFRDGDFKIVKVVKN